MPKTGTEDFLDFYKNYKAQQDYEDQQVDALANTMLNEDVRQDYYSIRDKEIEKASKLSNREQEPLEDTGKVNEYWNKVVDGLTSLLPDSIDSIEIDGRDRKIDDILRVDEVKDGRIYDRRNKDAGVFENKSLDELKDEYTKTKDDPNALYGLYTLRYYNGRDENGDAKYVYKSGIAKNDVWNRYKNQLGNNAEILDFKRFANAKDFEGRLNQLAFDKNLNVAQVGQDKSSGLNFGSGYTEVVKEDVFGLDKGLTATEQAQKLDQQRIMHEAYQKYRSHLDKNDTLWSIIKGGDYGDAFQTGAIELGADIGDAVAGVIGWIGNEVGIKNKLAEKNVFQEWSKNAAEIAGYDEKEVNSAILDATDAFNRGEYAEAFLGSGVSTIAGEAVRSLPEMGLMMIGGVELGATKALARGLIEAEKAFKTAKTVEEIAQAGKTLAKAKKAVFETIKDVDKANKLINTHKASTISNLVNGLTKDLGFNAVVFKNTNNVIEDRIENGDKDIGMLEVAGIVGSQYLSALLDKEIFKDITGISGVTKAKISKLYETLPNAVKNSVVTKLGKVGLGVATSMGEEAGQEYIQTWTEILGKDLDVNGKSLEEVFRDKQNRDEAIGAMVAGSIGGGAMHLGGSTIGGTVSTIKNVGSSVKQKYITPITDDVIIPKQIQTEEDFKSEEFTPQQKAKSLLMHLDPNEEHQLADETVKKVFKDVVGDPTFTDKQKEFLTSAVTQKLTRQIEATKTKEDVLKVLDTHQHIIDSLSDIAKTAVVTSSLKDITNAIDTKIESISKGSFFMPDGTEVPYSEVFRGKAKSETTLKDEKISNPFYNKLSNEIVSLRNRIKDLELNSLPTEAVRKKLLDLEQLNGAKELNKDISEVATDINELGFTLASGQKLDGHEATPVHKMYTQASLVNNEPIGSFSDLSRFVISRLKKVKTFNKEVSDDRFLTLNLAGTMFKENLDLAEILDDSLAYLANEDTHVTDREAKIKFFTKLKETLNDANGAMARTILGFPMSDAKALKAMYPEYTKDADEETITKVLNILNDDSKSETKKIAEISNITNNGKTFIILPATVNEQILSTLTNFYNTKPGSGNKPKKVSPPKINVKEVAKTSFIEKMLKHYEKSKPIKTIDDSSFNALIKRILESKFTNKPIDFELKAISDVRLSPEQLGALKDVLDFYNGNHIGPKETKADDTLRQTSDVEYDLKSLYKTLRLIRLDIARGLKSELKDEEVKKILAWFNDEIQVLENEINTVQSDINHNIAEASNLNSEDSFVRRVSRMFDRLVKKLFEKLSKVKAKKSELGKAYTYVAKHLNTLKTSGKIDGRSKKKVLSEFDKMEKMLRMRIGLQLAREANIEAQKEQKSRIDRDDKEKTLKANLKVIMSDIKKAKKEKDEEKLLKLQARIKKFFIKFPHLKDSLNKAEMKLYEYISKFTKSQPKPVKGKGESQANKIKKASEVLEGESEEDAKNRVKRLMKGDLIDSMFTGLSDEDIEYLNSLEENDLVALPWDLTNEDDVEATIAVMITSSETKEQLQKNINQFGDNAKNINIDKLFALRPELMSNISASLKYLKDATAIILGKEIKEEVKEPSKVEEQTTLTLELKTKNEQRINELKRYIDLAHTDDQYNESLKKRLQTIREATIKKINILEHQMKVAQDKALKKKDKIIRSRKKAMELAPKTLAELVEFTKIKNEQLKALKDAKTKKVKDLYVKKLYKTNKAIYKRQLKMDSILGKQFYFKGRLSDKEVKQLVKMAEASNDKKFLELYNNRAEYVDELKDSIKLSEIGKLYINKIKAVIQKYLNIVKKIKEPLATKKEELKAIDMLLENLERKELPVNLDAIDYIGSKYKFLIPQFKKEDSLVTRLNPEAKDLLESKNTLLSKVMALLFSDESDRGKDIRLKTILHENSEAKFGIKELKVIKDFVKEVKLPNFDITTTKSLTSINKEGIVAEKQVLNDVIHLFTSGDVELDLPQFKQDKSITTRFVESEVEKALQMSIASIVALIPEIKFKLLRYDNDQLLEAFSTLSLEDIPQFRRALIKGEIPTVLLTKELSHMFKDLLGIKVSKDASAEVDSVLNATIISLLDVSLKGSNITTESNISTSSANMSTIALNKQLLDGMYAEEDIDDLKNAFSKFSYLLPIKQRQRPSLKPIEPVTTIRNSVIKLSPIDLDNLKKRNSTKYMFSKDLDPIAQIYNDGNEITVYELFGYKEIKPEDNIEDKLETEAHNDQIKREVDTLMDYYNEFKGKKFYLPYEVTKSKRTMIVSDLTPMDSKIHRLFVIKPEFNQEVEASPSNFRLPQEMKDFNFNSAELLEIAMGEAFGIGPDKLSKFGFFKQFRSKIDIYGNNGILILDPELNWLQEFIDLDYEDVTLIKSDYDNRPLVKAARILRELHQAKKNGNHKVVQSLTIEADAITSGTGLLSAITGSLDNYEFGAKTGIMTEEQHNTYEEFTKKLIAKKYGVEENDVDFNMPTLIEAGKYARELSKDELTSLLGEDLPMEFLDVYETVGYAVAESLVKNKSDLLRLLGDNREYVGFIDALITKFENDPKFVRKFAKQPTMTFNYGALTSSIIRHVTNELFVSEFLKDYRNNGEFSKKVIAESMRASNKKYKNMNDEELLRLFNEDPRNFDLTYEKSDVELIESVRARNIIVNSDIVDELHKMNNKTVGSGLRTAFDKLFSPITQYRKSLKTIDIVHKEAFQYILDKRITGKETKEEIQEILNELTELDLGYNLTFEGSVQEFYKNESIDSDKRAYVNTLNDKGQREHQASEKIKKDTEFAHNSSSLATVSIHHLDGEAMRRALDDNNFSSIYDAILFPTIQDALQNTVSNYNTAIVETTRDTNILNILSDKVEGMLQHIDKNYSFDEFKSERLEDALYVQEETVDTVPVEKVFKIKPTQLLDFDLLKNSKLKNRGFYPKTMTPVEKVVVKRFDNKGYTLRLLNKDGVEVANLKINLTTREVIYNLDTGNTKYAKFRFKSFKTKLPDNYEIDDIKPILKGLNTFLREQFLTKNGDKRELANYNDFSKKRNSLDIVTDIEISTTPKLNDTAISNQVAFLGLLKTDDLLHNSFSTVLEVNENRENTFSQPLYVNHMSLLNTKFTKVEPEQVTNNIFNPKPLLANSLDSLTDTVMKYREDTIRNAAKTFLNSLPANMVNEVLSSKGIQFTLTIERLITGKNDGSDSNELKRNIIELLSQTKGLTRDQLYKMKQAAYKLSKDIYPVVIQDYSQATYEDFLSKNKEEVKVEEVENIISKCEE